MIIPRRMIGIIESTKRIIKTSEFVILVYETFIKKIKNSI
jgi:hypothetical protein